MARAILLLLLAGCTPPPVAATHPATEPLRAYYVAQRMQPLNCGTPDVFKICPVPLLPIIKIEDLPPLVIPSVEIEQLPPQEPSPTSQAGF